MTAISARTTVEELAGLVAEQLRNHGIEAVLSGGALVTIYSENRYKSKDLDFVTSAGLREIERALAPLGFSRASDGRHFIHPGTEFLVEFPSGPLMVGNEHVQTQKVESIATEHGPILVLSPTDSAKDRLAAFLHWSDRQSLHQAEMIAVRHRVDISEIMRWAEGETKDSGKLLTIREAISRASQR